MLIDYCYSTVQTTMNAGSSSYCSDQDDDNSSKSLGSLVSNLVSNRGSNRELIAPRDDDAVLISREVQNSGGFTLSF